MQAYLGYFSGLHLVAPVFLGLPSDASRLAIMAADWT
jgi:hypothetical protein